MSKEILELIQLRKEVYYLGQIIRIYLSEREDIDMTGEESTKELLHRYAEKAWEEIQSST